MDLSFFGLQIQLAPYLHKSEDFLLITFMLHNLRLQEEKDSAPAKNQGFFSRVQIDLISHMNQLSRKETNILVIVE